MPNLPLILIAVGFVGWWATGLDDTLVLALILRNRPANKMVPILIGHVAGVLLILAIASAGALGLLQLEQGILDRRFLGLPVQNFAGLMPIAVGVLALREALVHKDDDDDGHDRDSAKDQPQPAPTAGAAANSSPQQFAVRAARLLEMPTASVTASSLPEPWRFVVLAMIGAVIYSIFSIDDLALHLGVLGGILRQSSDWSIGWLIAAYWFGNLIGEFTSLAAAHWLAVHLKTRRVLEIGAALAVIAVGGVVLLAGR